MGSATRRADRVRGPAWIAVNNTFTKILKPMKDKPSLDPETGFTRSMITTIGFREYVQWQGDIRIALRLQRLVSRGIAG